MSISAIRGALGVGIQSDKGAPAGTMHYFPTLSANVMPEQMAQALPPEVGGSMFSRGSYKAAVRSRGEIQLIPRANTIGWILAGLFNYETVTNVGGGLYDHKFYVGDSAAHGNKWLTVRRYIPGAYGEQMRDSRVGSFRLEVAAANVASAAVQFLGGQYDELPSADVAAEDGQVFLTCAADVTEGGAPFIVDRFSIEIGQALTDNEFRVGSYFLDDITALQRQVSMTADVRIKSRDLVAKVYRNGASAPNGSGLGSWSPVIYRSPVVLSLQTGEATPELFTLRLPAVDFLTIPVSMQGADLVRAQLTCQVTLASDNFDPNDLDSATLQPIIVTLRNGKSSVYGA